jgi:hypothetical protein
MRRLGDILPGIAAVRCIEEELRLARQMAAWERLSPNASGAAGRHTCSPSNRRRCGQPATPNVAQ